MPWKEASLMDQRLQFVIDYSRGLWSVTELCDRFGVSRKTGYKWIERYEVEGPKGLADRSRRPHSSPHAVPDPIVEALVALRRRRPRWSAKKLLWQLAKRELEWPLPAVSTAQGILRRRGLVAPRGRRRRKQTHPGRPLTKSTEPNDIWTADFKGEFRTLDGPYCYPLTVIDDRSRYVLACDAFLHPSHEVTEASFRRLFRTYGLPLVIRTDNGSPFASTGLARLSRLSVWWLQLGIVPELIEPARPDQNGRHERFHKTLKDEATKPPSSCCAAQQRRFNRYRRDFNENRPHEALGQVPPAQLYRPSERRVPQRLQQFTYPAHFERRRVSPNGCIRWHNKFVFVSSVLTGKTIGLEELKDGQWAIYLGNRYLGLFLEDQLTIEGSNDPNHQ
jgi:transposase InsO family protein